MEELDTKENTTNMISVRSISGLKWYCVQILEALRAANFHRSWISGQKLSSKVPWYEMNKYMNENVYLKKEIANKS